MKTIILQILFVLSSFAFLGVPINALADGPASEAGRRPSASMNERILRIPGDPARPVELQVTVYTPNGSGPFPLAVMNHGSDGNVRPELQPRYHLSLAAYYFLSRGYAVVMPMMRGYAGSGGYMEHRQCDYKDVGLSNALDIRAVIDYMAVQPSIDGKRVVVAGQSMGGWNTIALGTLHDPRVKGLINFAGGMRATLCENTYSALALAAKDYGAQTTIPSIWFYGEKDQVFSSQAWHGMYDAYTGAGGKAELVTIGDTMKDTHNFLGYPEILPIWAAKIDTFLSKLSLPSEPLYPDYLPAVFPPASNFAAIDDVDAVPYLVEQGKELYRQFLKKPMPRVFIVDPTGTASLFTGGFDPLGKALHTCQQHSQNCRPYAVDDHVVWTPPSPTPAPTHYAALQDVEALPYLSEVGRQAYKQFLGSKKPRAFVIAPDGTWIGTSLGVDPAAFALQACSKSHQGCQFYAVDNDVVWPAGAQK